MNGYNFTHGVRRALARSREEAARLHHPFVGTEHELLGLIASAPNLATEIIELHGVSRVDLANQMEGIVRAAETGATSGPDLPYTSRAKKALELSMSEALQLNHNEVNCGHLLLGLVHEERGIAAQVLIEAGITLQSARQRFHELMSEGRRDPGAEPAPHVTPERAAACLVAMAASPTIAAVFARHEIDLPTLIEDVRTAR